MSNKNTPTTTNTGETVTENPLVTINGTSSSSLKSSPLFGWLFAGSDLLSAKLDQAAGMVSQKIDDTHETIMAMQAKGMEVESELKRTLNPFSLVDTAQKLVTANPIFSVLSGGQKRQQKEQQLALLNAKVDLLVEQVALLAAKEAAAKVEKSTTKEEAPKASSTKRAPAKAKTTTRTRATAAKAATPKASIKTAASKASTSTSTTKRKAPAAKAAPSTTATTKTSKSADTKTVSKDGEDN
ncbi:MAG: hypothetical protein VX061_01655 [Pseudomonadota bacterium]|nr:hypothetical protein [Pseudomonadota bacterium]